MCKHINNPKYSLREIYTIIENVNTMLENRMIAFADYYTKKEEVLSWVEVSHQPVVANKFVV